MNQFNINLKQRGFYADRYFIRVTDGGTVEPIFSRYGDTILVTPSYDTDYVDNITTGQSYTYGGEQGTPIPDISSYPLTKKEINNLKVLIESKGL